MSSSEANPDLPLDPDVIEELESPRHGFQGDRGELPMGEQYPASLTVAVSREAGSRGSSIAARAGQRLGWQIYNQELLEYIAQEGAFRQDVVENLAPAAAQWVEQRLDKLMREQNLSQHPSILDLARTILALGSHGDVIMVGRGAGCILPRESTLHVRTVAPRGDRIAYMSQWQRLTEASAAEQVEMRDSRRAEFISTHFHRQPNDVHLYDLVLNTSLLGEDLCADLIVRAAQAKLEALRGARQGSVGSILAEETGEA